MSRTRIIMIAAVCGIAAAGAATAVYVAGPGGGAGVLMTDVPGKTKHLFVSSDNYVLAMAYQNDHEQIASECARILAETRIEGPDTKWCAEYAEFVSGHPDAEKYLERTLPLEGSNVRIITFYGDHHVEMGSGMVIDFSDASTVPELAEIFDGDALR